MMQTASSESGDFGLSQVIYPSVITQLELEVLVSDIMEQVLVATETMSLGDNATTGEALPVGEFVQKTNTDDSNGQMEIDTKVTDKATNKLADMPIDPSLTVKEKALVEEFISKIEKTARTAEPLESITFSPNWQTAVRFLRARDWKMDPAVSMYNEAVHWAKDYGLRAKCDKWRNRFMHPKTENDKLFVKYWPTSSLGKDKEGMTVGCLRNGVADYGGLLGLVENNREAFMCSYFWRLEDSMREAYEIGKGHMGFIDLYDMGAAGVPSWTKRAYTASGPFQTLATYLDKCFPERVRKTYIVNVPWMFNAIWKIFRPLVPKATRQKIEIYGSSTKDQGKWIEDMKQFIDLDVVPKAYGGSGSDNAVPCGGIVKV